MSSARPLLFAVLVGSTSVMCSAADLSPAVTATQIEADWFSQDEVWGKEERTRAKNTRISSFADVTPDQDAAGAVDGYKDGTWGFHTANEQNPWWQVDLGQTIDLDRLVLFNRCDGAMAKRAARIVVLLSQDGKTFDQAYQHDGNVFLGYTDKKPLVVKLKTRKARYLRLQLPGKSYFHLDEVEVYAAGHAENVARGKPATQSSTSRWSALAHGVELLPSPLEPCLPFATQRIIDQGLKLAASLMQHANAEALHSPDQRIAEQRSVLQQVATAWKALPANASEVAQRELYRRARWAVRRMALSNPLLDFDEILFVKRAPGMFPHMSDQYYGWWSRGGGGVCLLSGFKGEHPSVRCLTTSWPTGNFLRPDLSYDGKRVLFAYCKYDPDLANVRDKTNKDQLSEDTFYHIYEMNLDGSRVRQLTRGRYDDFDARYLPDGDIVFLSTRKGIWLQTSRQGSEASCRATLPDSYVRCGGDNHRPVSVFTLHRMDGNGSNLRPISAFENFEWTPTIAADGRIVYARWDYIDRFNGFFISLWSMLPDGRGARLVYGNYTRRPQCVFEARPVPHSNKLIATASAHHSINGGSLVLLDVRQGTEQERPIQRLTPQVCFPETEGWPAAYYSGPWPLSEDHFLVAWSNRPLPKHRLMAPDDPHNPRNPSGIYLADAFGNLNLLYRDSAISCTNPIPVRPRVKPPVLPDQVVWDGPQEGRFLVQDIYRGLEGIERGTVRRLRVVAVPPKVQPQKNQPILGVSKEEPGKFILGTVPVEDDGSAYFRVPSGVSLFFQALDRDGFAVQTMRSLTYVQPGETVTCIGCHESRNSTPSNRVPFSATTQLPSKITPGPAGSWPLSYATLIQPVLDAQCVSCHKPDAIGKSFDLTPAKSYESLMSFADGDLEKLAFERDRSLPRQCPASRSQLLRLLTAPDGHQGVHLDSDSVQRLVTWMDTYSQRTGSFSAEQEEQIREFRWKIRALLAK